MNEVITTTDKYLGTDGFGYVYLAALVYLFCFEKKLRKPVVYSSLFVTIIVLNPLLYRWVYVKVFDYAYWRALWIIPILPVIAIAFCSVINRCRRQWLKLTMVLLLSGVIILCGNNIYTTDLGRYASFQPAENIYKIPQSVIRVADALLALEDEPSAFLPDELFCYIRQYSGKIRLMHGRYSSGLHGGKLVKEVAALNTDAPCFLYIHNRMKTKSIQYLVYENKCISDDEIARCGFIKRSSVDNYGIYELDTEMDFSQGSWQAIRYKSGDGERIMGYAIISAENDGKMILIDCARAEDKQELWSMIEQEKLRISSWIITEPHSGSVDTLSEILAKHPEVSIENLYVFDGHDGCPQEDAVLAARSNLTVLQAGDEVNLNGLSLKVLHAGTEDEAASTETCTQSDPVFKLTGKEKSILFCGDMDTQTAVSLLENSREDLASTYVQMGALENAEVGAELCEAIAPEEVFIDVTDGMENGGLEEEQAQLAKHLHDKGAVCHTDTDTIHIMVI